MHFIKNQYDITFPAVCLFLFMGITNAIACPCFNHAFLQLTFQKSNSTKCVVHKNTTSIHKAEMSDAKHLASSTHSECLLNTAHHNVYMNFGQMDLSIHNIEHHQDCIDAIVDACNHLNIPLENREF